MVKAAGSSHRPTNDLIILDLMLPGMPGSEVLRRIRKNNSQVPVLVLTARDALTDKVEHFEAGADDYLTKLSVRHEKT